MPARSRIDIHWPAVEGHPLVIPRRHVASLFDLGRPEVSTCMTLLQKSRDRLIAGDNTITGFNVGMNDGEDAGQTIFHCHWHLITPIPQPSRDNRWVSNLRFDNFHSGCQAEKAQRRASKGVKLERSSATASITSLAKA